MKVAIIGTRGIPNHYGGFEQFAEYLSDGLSKKDHQVYVYNSHNHPFKQKKWKNVSIIHCYDPEYKLGTFGQFVYDLNCILDSRKRDFDVILQLGYTSSSIWNVLFKSGVKIVTNMDGLEWKRTKFSMPTKLFLKLAEWLAVKFSNELISDSVGIKDYLLKKYNVNSTYIPYGATVCNHPNKDHLKKYNLTSFEYDILVARIEPENNIETIINGFISSNVNRKLVVVGSLNTRLAKKIVAKITDERVMFLGFISSINVLNSLRYYSNLYFHGHTVGGTNPSLLEAMSSNALICAHNNIFNRSILENDAFYFKNQEDIRTLTEKQSKQNQSHFCQANLKKIQEIYSYSEIISKYEQILTPF